MHLPPLLLVLLRPTRLICGCYDLDKGFRSFCKFVLGLCVLGVFYEGLSLLRKQNVWEEVGSFNTYGLGVYRILLFIFLGAAQIVGMLAHSKRNSSLAKIVFIGWMVFAFLYLIFEIIRLSTIETDALAIENQSCDKCRELFPNATSCQDPKVMSCTKYDVSRFKSFAYLYSSLSMVFTSLFNIYATMMARSFWFLLRDDVQIDFGNDPFRSMDSNPEGGNSLYVKMENLFNA
ncbi:hypothetical protein GUITHDRAFT_154632 [Guillardia theta CCMP2712]|uniref:Uncharacterized protein n=1 Tax=Guillardia theta (strain CCMP2712) TaxID=905079 RepID=L1ISF1_GUITC|nr:hypothetical protein GUITHDRAFT_154632 [Guillardia theta CCMP2712]EKX38804.1 hypothetical protein GUITHDRAFT_154632 [Guillardia theta CCMP2712]|mmetsp:Transcript_248/g.547  ORF Transcript_248/g.547 Transcript_248/m.547 type:complete len:233 (-) Transcript_248:255-953(-)|eukprot:XP_005825784.1 hypothetical protein GUITHDRAFT_154632 [Guillardia theta CCMP2712]